MGLEKEIQTNGFRNERHKGILNIFYTYYYLVNQVNDGLKPFDVTRQQYNVLRILRGQYPNQVAIYTIRERMLDKMSDASRIVERLRLKGLVIRESAKKDKRASAVTITEQGLNLLELMEPKMEQMDFMMTNLNEKEIRHLNALLDKIRENHVQHIPESEGQTGKSLTVEKLVF